MAFLPLILSRVEKTTKNMQLMNYLLKEMQKNFIHADVKHLIFNEVSSICVNKVFSHLFVKKVFLQMEIKLRPRIRTLLNCSSFLDLLYER